ncbi:chromatin modification- protein VID21 [Coemansia spiralis]|uniref:Vacuolar import and degradation protein 21 n=1 Tax=Coemansia spiralis TaxID=417178 RepID=A0A9W8G4G7_9FUNG|nr:chromatin modification- protein VID21 [Coemansia spiralis]
MVEEFQKFLAMYAENSDAALSSRKALGQRIWMTEEADSRPQTPELMPKKETKTEASEPMDVDKDSNEDEEEEEEFQEAESFIDKDAEAMRLIHPEDVVFLSQLGPMSIAEVTEKHPVKAAEMLENSVVYQAYCDQIEDFNCKSVSMYNWLLHSQEQPLSDVVACTQKLLSTKDWDAVRDELTRVRIMERIEELKDKGKWSFFQPRKHRAPPRTKAHWDYLLDEVTWMHTDFVEERKLRIAMTRMISSWVMDYHHAADKSLYTVSATKNIIPDIFMRERSKSMSMDENMLSATESDTPIVPESQTRTMEDDLSKVDATSEHVHTGPVSAIVTAAVSAADSHNIDSQEAKVPTSEVQAADSVGSSSFPLNGVVAEESADVDRSTTGKLPDAEPTLSKPEDEVGINAAAVVVEENTKEPKDYGSTSTQPIASLTQAKSTFISTISDDRIVPSSIGSSESSQSVYQIFAHLAQQESIEDILGDSIYTLQALNSLHPYVPAWDESYCDILDAFPVVPICKTMWSDFALEEPSEEPYDSTFTGDYYDTVDISDLIKLNTDDPSSLLGAEPESQGARSIFTRNIMAPPLLTMFTQTNKPPRNVHASVSQPPADTPAQQTASDACPGQAVFEWSAERDKMLAKIIQQYAGNWPLIAETFNHAFSLFGSRALNSRICYERWSAIKEDYPLDRTTIQTGFDEPEYGPRKPHSWSSQFTVHPSATQLSAMQLANSIVSHSETLKIVSASKKKRDAAPKSTPVPPREIKPLPADQKVPTPAEMAKVKFEHDRRLQQLFMEQRQATAAAAALAMQQQRALNPQLQALHLNRQIAVLQAMLASGRGLQRPLTPAQSKSIQQQIHNLQLLQQQQQQQIQLQLAQAAQQQGQLNMGQAGLPQQHIGIPMQQQQNGVSGVGVAGSPGLRFTPEQIQQILQARAANGVRPNISPALAAMLNARAQFAGANGNIRAMGMPRLPNAAASATANLLPPQQRQMFLQQLAQQQAAMGQSGQMQRSVTAATSPQQQPIALTPLSPQMGTPSVPSHQQSGIVPSGAPGSNGSNMVKSPIPTDISVAHQASPTASSEHSTPLMQTAAQMPGNSLPVSNPLQQPPGIVNGGFSPAQAQAILAAQQAMQLKQLQAQQQQPQQQQIQMPQVGVNQPQLAQYLSSLFPHQLAQLSNQQRMNLLAMRQFQQLQQQQQQQQPGQPGQPGGQNLLNQQAALQALQQNIMAGNTGTGAMNGFAGLNHPASQQLLAAQIAQNLKNQQMLNAASSQGQNQASPQPPQQNMNQLHLMRIRQAIQQQQQQQLSLSSPGPSVSAAPGQSSPAMATPVQPGMPASGFPVSTPLSAQMSAQLAAVQQAGVIQAMAAQQPNMSPVLPQQPVMSPPLNSQAHTPRPPQSLTPMQGPLQMPQQRPQQQTQQAMMLAAAAAAGLSTSAAQALIAQIAASTEANQQQQPQPDMQSLGNNENAGASVVSSKSPSSAAAPAAAFGAESIAPNVSAASPGAVAAHQQQIGVANIVRPPAATLIATPTTPTADSTAAGQKRQPASPGIQKPRPSKATRPGNARPHAARQPSQKVKSPATPTGARPVLRPSVTPSGVQTPQSQSRPVTPVSASSVQQPRRPPLHPGQLPLQQNTTSPGSASVRGSATPSPSTPVSRASTPNPQTYKAAGSSGNQARPHPPSSSFGAHSAIEADSKKTSPSSATNQPIVTTTQSSSAISTPLARHTPGSASGTSEQSQADGDGDGDDDGDGASSPATSSASSVA